MRYFELYETKTAVILEYSTEGKSKAQIDEMLARLRLIVQQSDFIGERDNAQDLINKILGNLGREPEEPQAKPEPKRAGVPAGPGSFKVVFFGHFFDPMAGERGSDKVWGWGVKGDNIYQFWGKNGGVPQVKHLANTPGNRAALDTLAGKKERKGYNKIAAANHVEWLESVLRKSPKFVG